MPPIESGTVNAEPDHDFILFLIGMRIHRLRRVHRWWPVFKAMSHLLHTLDQDPALGLLSNRGGRNGRHVFLIQCWESEEKLMDFSRAPDHHGYWKWYNTALSRAGDIGIWHEVFRVPAGSYDGCYLNMPIYGMADALGAARLPHTHGRRPAAADPPSPTPGGVQPGHR